MNTTNTPCTVLFAVTDFGAPVLAATGEDVLADIAAVSSDMADLHPEPDGGWQIPKEHGVYIWQGSVSVVYRGAVRLATAADLKEFGLLRETNP